MKQLGTEVPNKNDVIDEISVEQKDCFRDCSLIIVDYQITFKITQITDYFEIAFEFYGDYVLLDEITGLLLRLFSSCTTFFQVVDPSFLSTSRSKCLRIQFSMFSCRYRNMNYLKILVYKRR